MVLRAGRRGAACRADLRRDIIRVVLSGNEEKIIKLRLRVNKQEYENKVVPTLWVYRYSFE